MPPSSTVSSPELAHAFLEDESQPQSDVEVDVGIAGESLEPLDEPEPEEVEALEEEEDEEETQDAFDELPGEDGDRDVEDAQAMEVDDEDASAVKDAGKKRKTKNTIELVRPPGKSLLPLSRVSKIIKADKVLSSRHLCHKRYSMLLRISQLSRKTRFSSSRGRRKSSSSGYVPPVKMLLSGRTEVQYNPKISVRPNPISL